MAIHAFYSFFKTVAPTFFFKMSTNIFFQNVSTFFLEFFSTFSASSSLDPATGGGGGRSTADGWVTAAQAEVQPRGGHRCPCSLLTNPQRGTRAQKEPTAGVAEAPVRRPRRRKHERQSNSGRVDEIRIWCDDPTTTRNQLICDRFCMTFSENVIDMLMAHSGLDFGPRLYDRALISS